uniref:PLAT domain-containing protein n=1 Tax=Panagrolaimus davidi TaxID=227884 RepID=A0A914PCX9_9BILA
MDLHLTFFFFAVVAAFFFVDAWVPGTIEYSSFSQGNYTFNGKIVCLNNNSIGDEAKVTLYKVDNSTAMDFVDENKIGNDTFSLSIKDDLNVWTTTEMEFFIKFENCCGYWAIRIGGFLKNSTLVTYTLHDENMFADINA